MRRDRQAVPWTVGLTLLVLALIPPASGAQQQPPVAVEQHGEKTESRLIEVHHADPNELASVLSIFGVEMTPNSRFKVIGVEGSPEAVQAVEQAVKQLDKPAPARPKKNVELTVYLVAASRGDAATTAVELQAIPGQLEGVIGELRDVFGYSNYGLMDIFLLRCRDGEGIDASGLFQPADDAEPSEYRFQVERVTVTTDNNIARVHLDDLILGFTVPIKISTATTRGEGAYRIQRQDLGIRSDVDFDEWRLVVVGKASVAAGVEAVFLVISAKIVD